MNKTAVRTQRSTRSLSERTHSSFGKTRQELKAKMKDGSLMDFDAAFQFYTGLTYEPESSTSFLRLHIALDKIPFDSSKLQAVWHQVWLQKVTPCDSFKQREMGYRLSLDNNARMKMTKHKTNTYCSNPAWGRYEASLTYHRSLIGCLQCWYKCRRAKNVQYLSRSYSL